MLKKLIKIKKDQSDNESDATDVELCDNESEDEDLRYIAPSKKRARVISDSETENDLDAIDTSCNKEISTEKAADGTLWETLKEGRNVGKLPGYTYTILKDVSGPTAYAKRHIMLGSASSAFNLIIDEGMIEYIKSCTELEARKVLNNEWTVTKSQLWAFVAILYARGAYQAKNLKCSYLWSTKWGPAFFSQAMSRDKLIDILRFIRFDKKKMNAVKD